MFIKLITSLAHTIHTILCFFFHFVVGVGVAITIIGICLLYNFTWMWCNIHPKSYQKQYFEEDLIIILGFEKLAKRSFLKKYYYFLSYEVRYFLWKYFTKRNFIDTHLQDFFFVQSEDFSLWNNVLWHLPGEDRIAWKHVYHDASILKQGGY